MYNSQLKIFVVLILNFLGILTGLFLYQFVVQDKNIAVDTSSSFFCLEKLEKGLNISNLTTEQPKLLILSGNSCLKSTGNVDEIAPEYKQFSDLSSKIIDQPKIRVDDRENLNSSINSLRSRLQNIEQDKASWKIVSSLSLIGIFVIPMVFLLFSATIPYYSSSTLDE